MKKVLLFMTSLIIVLSLSFSQVQAAQKVVYLTFDDGPSDLTPKVLSVLKKYNVKATFFVTGQRPKCFHYIREAFLDGHSIAAHSYTHNFKIYKSTTTYYQDLGKIEKVIKKQTGMTSRVIRFPGGSSNVISRHYKKGIMTTLTKSVLDKDYQYYDWNVDSTDAQGNNRPVKKIIKYACSNKHNQAVVLMHDTAVKKTTLKALPKIIEYYKKHHYTFGTLKKNTYVCHHHVNN